MIIPLKQPLKKPKASCLKTAVFANQYFLKIPAILISFFDASTKKEDSRQKESSLSIKDTIFNTNTYGYFQGYLVLEKFQYLSY